MKKIDEMTIEDFPELYVEPNGSEIYPFTREDWDKALLKELENQLHARYSDEQLDEIPATSRENLERITLRFAERFYEEARESYESRVVGEAGAVWVDETHIAITLANISKLEVAGNRWQKYGKDRIYLSMRSLGLKLKFYKTGNIDRTWWQGESASNNDGRRLQGSKVFVDVKTGELVVETCYYSSDEDLLVENVAKRYINELLG